MPTVIRNGDTSYAQKGAHFEGNVKIDGNFIVPARTNFWGQLTVTGTLELGPGSSVALGVNCWNAVIGRQPQRNMCGYWHLGWSGCPVTLTIPELCYSILIVLL
jgi:hypothetical protein